MNEKLKELAEQAGFEITSWGNESLPCVHHEGPIDVELTKFAQLIVLECIQNIRDNMEIAKVDTLGDKDLFLETLRTSGHFYITELEQHFGVEEQTESQKMVAAGYTRRPRGWTKEGTE